MSKIFAIYPIDKSTSTKFLNRINTFENRNLGTDWHCYKIHFSDEDHEECLRISKVERFIFYMGHGGETKLCGACGKYGEMSVDAIAKEENPEFYIKDEFINSGNISEFKNQILFCFSCNSNRNTPKSLGRLAIQCGVLSFVGFGDIPTDYIEGVAFSKRSIAVYKGLIIKIVKLALLITAKNNGSVYSLVRLIQILTTKEIQNLLLSKDNIRHKKSIVDQLLSFKNDIRILGDRYMKIC